MPNDATLDNIEIKKEPFRNPDMERRAQELLQEWPSTFAEMEDKFGDDQERYGYVYRKHMGDADFPEDDRTVEQLKAKYDSIKNYKILKEMGEIDPHGDDDPDLEAVEKIIDNQEMYVRGWTTARQMALEVGAENVPENPGTIPSPNSTNQQSDERET